MRREDKIGALFELRPDPHENNPCPQIPDKFLDVAKMDEVTRNIKSGVPQKGPFVTHDASALNDAESLTHETIVMESPLIEHREVIASLADSTTFGKLLAARAWSLGFAGAPLKAFIADSSSTNWGIWQGKVQPVIAEVATRVAELGSLPPDASTTDPRQIVADTLTYLTNQQSRMNYPAYRQSGLPITSSPIESTVKQINHRVKGSEKFWSASGGEALLQLRADQLSDTNPLDLFWTNRTREATGPRNHKKQTTTSA